MAADAVSQLGHCYPIFAVFLGDFHGIMLMTAVAGVFDVDGFMAGDAGDLGAFTVIEGKVVADQLSRQPAGGSMAGGAVGAEGAEMDLGFKVTRFAVAGCCI